MATRLYAVTRREVPPVHFMCWRPVTTAGLAMALLLVALDRASAQETRGTAIEQAQAERGQALQPPRQNGVEKLIDRLEDWSLIAGQPRGVYPWLGSIYPGGGFAGGLGFRQPLGDDRALRATSTRKMYPSGPTMRMPIPYDSLRSSKSRSSRRAATFPMCRRRSPYPRTARVSTAAPRS